MPTPDAIFLDRDGTINVERPDYVKTWSEFAFLPGALEALALLAQLHRPILLITNQSGIGRGHVLRATVDGIHHRLAECVAAAGGRIDAVYLCPHHPDDRCACRKPAPGLLLQAAAEWGIDLRRSVFIGDSVSDQEAAVRAGCRPLLVASGRQAARLRMRKEQGESDLLFADIAEAARWIADHAPVAADPAAHIASPLEWVTDSHG